MCFLPPLRRVLLPASLATSLWLVVSGCSSDVRVQTYPIEVSQLEFPDSVEVGRADSILVVAVVGHTGFSTAELRLARSGDSLVVSGTFQCRFEESVAGPEPPAADRLAMPPAPIETLVALGLPELEPGTYRVVAERWGFRLTDTLVVANEPVRRHRRLAGFGALFEHGEPECASLPVAYGASAWGLLGPPRYLVLNPPDPAQVSGAVEIHATIVGPASCDSSFTGVLQTCATWAAGTDRPGSNLLPARCGARLEDCAPGAPALLRAPPEKGRLECASSPRSASPRSPPGS